jgi:hypothetical protein
MTLEELVSGIAQLLMMAWGFMQITVPIINVSLASIFLAILIIQLSTMVIKKYFLKDKED